MAEPGSRYRLVRMLGSGGMATVWLAHDTALDRDVAIKRVHTPASDESVRRLLREARIGAGLRHPALVTVHDALVEDDEVVVVMEYVEGETLQDALRHGPLEPARTLEILRPVAEALDVAHAARIVHRDVKPANVLLAADGRVKLADLGIAWGADLTRITRDGALLGTLGYVAPEVLAGADTKAAADIYALAAVAFEMFTGQRARTGRTPIEVLRAAEEQPPPDLAVLRPDLPQGAAAALARGMARDPSHRPPSASALVEELARAFVPARAREPVPRRSRAPLLAAAALAVVVAGVVVAVVASSGSDPAPPRARTTVTRSGQTQTRTTPARRLAEGPSGAVRAFYTAAARQDWPAAWTRLGPRFRAEFGSQDSMARQLASLRRVQFSQLTVEQRAGDAAVVRLETVATHTDRVDHCTGTLGVVRSGGRWLVEPRSVTCQAG